VQTLRLYRLKVGIFFHASRSPAVIPTCRGRRVRSFLFFDAARFSFVTADSLSIDERGILFFLGCALARKLGAATFYIDTFRELEEVEWLSWFFVRAGRIFCRYGNVHQPHVENIRTRNRGTLDQRSPCLSQSCFSDYNCSSNGNQSNTSRGFCRVFVPWRCPNLSRSCFSD
jgi:hypothetical protein